MSTTLVKLKEVTTEIRKSLIKALYNADSGHPGSCLSCVEIIASLFFNKMDLDSDRFILSKGHAAPTLYAALCMKGYADKNRFEQELRKIESPFQGHPVADSLPHIYASTGSLGQGLSFALGMAEGKRLNGNNGKVYVLLGDGELQEGQNWEAFRYGPNRKLDNLVAIIDKNGYQNDAAVNDTMPLGDLEGQLITFGWNVINVNGHSINELLIAYNKADSVKERPSVVIAETVKGKGINHIETNRKKHNGAMTPEEYSLAMRDLGVHISETHDKTQDKPPNIGAFGIRDAFGEALLEVGEKYENIVVVDCDLGSATKTLKFRDKFPERFFQAGIAEQHGVSLAAGLSKEGYRPFISSFGAFLTQRAKDQIMNSVAYSKAGVVLVGSHSGLAIGKDGATQMGIDDINAMRGIPEIEIYSPASPVEMKQVVEYLAKGKQYAYLRTSRRPVPAVHDSNYVFNLNKADVLLDCNDKNGISIIATGDMVYYALKSAEALLKEGINVDVINIARLQPIDRETIIKYGNSRRGLFTLEDHGIVGGLGTIISEIVAEEGLIARVRRHGIKGFGESGDPDDLYRKHELDVNGICINVKNLHRQTYK